MKILVIFGMLISQISLAQKLEIEYGKISQKEFEMESYEKDIEAKAVILYDKGKSIFFDTDKGYDIRFTRHKRIKIFDKSASQYAEVSIPYYVDINGETELVKSIEAVTYNTINGKLTQKKLDPETIYEERINERLYNLKFIFPDVQDGAILEYRYILETPNHFNLPDWTFQDKIPTVYSEYQVSMIPFYEYVFCAQGITGFDYYTSEFEKEKRTWGRVNKLFGRNMDSGIEFQDYVHTYVLKDIPAFEDETFISSINDYIIKMDFQLAKVSHPTGGTSEIISTWNALNKSLLKHDKFGKYLKNCSKIAKKILANELMISGENEPERAKQIIEYMKSRFEWNGKYGKYASQSAKEFYKKTRGNAADINLFMIAMLNEAEVSVEPVILSTRNHGKIPTDYPFDHFTNYVISFINTESPFLADATEELLPYNKVPLRCNNEKGLIVEKENTQRWISLGINEVSLENNTVRMELDSISMDIKAKVYIQSTEYESFYARNKFKNDSLKVREFYKNKIGEIGRLRITGYSNPNRPYCLNFETSVETEKFADNIVVKPFLNLPMANNSLTHEKRIHPVDFVYPWENRFESFLEVPAEFLIAQLPEEYNHDNELVEINLNYSIVESVLTVKGKYKFKKSIYAAHEYAQIKQYMDEIVKKFNQPIVLEKRN